MSHVLDETGAEVLGCDKHPCCTVHYEARWPDPDSQLGTNETGVIRIDNSDLPH